MSKRDSEKTENTPADAGKDAETDEENSEFILSYKKDTDRYNVAKALIAGETDRGKLIRNYGVSINTIYNVTTELTANGYVLAIHKKKKNPPPQLLLHKNYFLRIRNYFPRCHLRRLMHY